MRTINCLFVWVLALSFLLMGCNGVRQFSDKNPYAIELARARSYYQSEKMKSRLEKMKIPVYTVLLSDEVDESSQWYVLLAGAAKDSTDLADLKDKMRDDFNLKNVSTVNFLTLKKRIQSFSKSNVEEVAQITANRPDIPDNVYALLEKFPQNDQFDIENLGIYNFSEASIPRQFRQSFYNAKMDLPRGVSKSLVAQNSEAFAEVIYKDNLYGDQMTVDVLKLKADHGLDAKPRARLSSQSAVPASSDAETAADNIAWFFASLILNTGRYITEEYQGISVNSYTSLIGYKVVIEPRRDYLRTYFVLVDIVGGFVIFSQSTTLPDADVMRYLEAFGQSQGALAYNEFHNAFFTLPYCLMDEGDLFLGFNSEVLTNAYAWSKGNADWAQALVGHTTATAEFYNRNLRQYWSASNFDLITRAKKSYVYDDMYTNKDYSGRTAIKVNESKGFFVSDYLSKEVNFATNTRYVFTINAYALPKAEMLKRARKLQTGEKGSAQDPCGTGKTPPNGTPPVQPPVDTPTTPPPPPPPPPTTSQSPTPCGQGQIVTQYAKDNPNFLEFHQESTLGSVPNLSAAFDQLLAQADFLMPSTNQDPVTDCAQLSLKLSLYPENPVLVRLNRQQYTVEIYSLPQNKLHPFRVTRSIRKTPAGLVIATDGQTTSKLPATQEWSARYFWQRADKNLLAALSK